MTSQDYIKVERVWTWLLRSSVAKFRQFHSECCFWILIQFFFRLRRPCSVVAFLVLWFPCFVLLAKIEKFLYFFSSEIFNRFLGESHVFRRSSFFCTFCWWLWGFEFAPASGIPVRVGDHVRTSQEPLKSEHVKTSLLSSSLAIFQQFCLNSFFSRFV